MASYSFTPVHSGQLLITNWFTDWPTTLALTSASAVSGSSFLNVQFEKNDQLRQSLFSSDTSSIADTEVVTSAVLSIGPVAVHQFTGDLSTITLEVRAYNWGGTVEVGDWVSGPTEWNSLPLLATAEITASSSGTITFTSAPGFQAAISKTGTTYFILGASVFGNASAPASAYDYRVAFTPTTFTLAIETEVPTITGVSPSAGTTAGGTSITITGTGLVSGATVTVGGVAATSVSVVNSTTITCVTPAGSAGFADVAVTQSGTTTTLSNGFLYGNITDSTVKLVRAGSVVGDNKASATVWPGALGFEEYGGANDLWGTTFTPAQVNASDFGFVLSATGTTGTAQVDVAEMSAYYTLSGIEDRASFLVVLGVDAARAVATPYVYKLPRNSLSVANDPNLNLAVSNKYFNTPRITDPDRTIKKIYRKLEFWLDLSQQFNHPGVQARYKINEATSWTQLLNSGTGTAVTFYTSGFKEAWFPASSAAVGNYVQLQFVIPATSATQTDVKAAIRNIRLKLRPMPLTGSFVRMTLVLAGGEFQQKTSMRRTAAAQRRALRALADPTAAPVAYRSPEGETGYAQVTSVQFREQLFKGQQKPSSLADVDMVILSYD